MLRTTEWRNYDSENAGHALVYRLRTKLSPFVRSR